MLLTTDPAEFQHSLQAGDVLVFDSLTFLPGLVQWADRAPANHVALVVDREQGVEANKSRPGGSNPEPAVKLFPLSERFTVAQLSTVTARRHGALTDPAVRDAVVARARRDVGNGCFSHLDLLFLGPSALHRSYGAELAKLGRLGAAAGFALGLAAAAALARVKPDAFSLICSEYVYRCYSEAGVPGLRLEISEPLGLAGQPPSMLPDELHDELERWETLRRHNNEDVRGCGSKFDIVADDQVADRVTAGDLLRSPSLATVVVLHRPGAAGQEPSISPVL